MIRTSVSGRSRRFLIIGIATLGSDVFEAAGKTPTLNGIDGTNITWTPTDGPGGDLLYSVLR